MKSNNSIVALLMGLLVSVSGVSLPRGVNPTDASLYRPTQGQFHCLDGLKKIPFARVNDDFCDCFDGSDEPDCCGLFGDGGGSRPAALMLGSGEVKIRMYNVGTSACLNGQFYCQNVGDEPRVLNASMVDDGICDCCDGTDEKKGLCANECIIKGQKALEHVQEVLKDAKEGLKVKSKLEKTAATTRKSWESRLEDLENDESSKAEQKAAAEVKKEQAQNKLQRLRERLRSIEEQIKARDEAEKGVQANESEGQNGFEAGATKLPPDEDDVRIEGESKEDRRRRRKERRMRDRQRRLEQEAAEAAQNDETTGNVEEEETEEEIAKRIASQWIPGSSSGPNDAVKTPEEQEPEVNDGTDEEPYEFPGENTYDAPDGDVEDETEAPETHEPEVIQPKEQHEKPHSEEALGIRSLLNKAKLWFESLFEKDLDDLEKERKLVKSQVDIAEKHFNTLNTEAISKRSDYDALKREQEELNKKISNDYGVADVYIPIAESCVEGDQDKYTYKLCPYGDAHQIDGTHKTLIGRFVSFDGETMKFENGDSCWQGPSRSIKVKVVCGSIDKVEKISEPSRCTYEGILKTPAACTPNYVTELEEDIERRQMLLQSRSHDEL